MRINLEKTDQFYIVAATIAKDGKVGLNQERCLVFSCLKNTHLSVNSLKNKIRIELPLINFDC